MVRLHDHDPNLVIFGIDVCGMTDDEIAYELERHGLQNSPILDRRLYDKSLVKHLQEHLDNRAQDCPVTIGKLPLVSFKIFHQPDDENIPVHLMDENQLKETLERMGLQSGPITGDNIQLYRDYLQRNLDKTTQTSYDTSMNTILQNISDVETRQAKRNDKNKNSPKSKKQKKENKKNKQSKKRDKEKEKQEKEKQRQKQIKKEQKYKQKECENKPKRVKVLASALQKEKTKSVPIESSSYSIHLFYAFIFILINNVIWAYYHYDLTLDNFALMYQEKLQTGDIWDIIRSNGENVKDYLLSLKEQLTPEIQPQEEREDQSFFGF